jgi:hypothetical protein
MGWLIQSHDMCDVHLIEHSRKPREFSGMACSYCGEHIIGKGILVSGSLDDGTPGVYEFAYHDDCVFDMEFDQAEIASNDGCFSYGRPLPSTSP